MIPEIPKRTVVIRTAFDRQILHRLIDNLPDGAQVAIGPETKVRKQSQNDLMWASQLKDISEQAWVQGRQFRDEVWHEHFKAEYLPEIDDPELDRLVKNPDTYKKWDTNPKGERICVGSTTELTVYGFSQYLMKLEAYAVTELGVKFMARAA